MPRSLRSKIRSRIFREPAGVDAGCRLVEEHQPRLLHQRLRQADALQHALRVAAHAAVCGVLEIDHREQLGGALPQLFLLQPAQLAVEHQRLRTGEVLVEIRVLRQETDRPPAVHMAAVAPEDRGLARRRADQPQQHLHGGRLARAVRPDEPVDRTGRHLEGDVVDRQHVLPPQRDGEVLRQVLDQHRRRVGALFGLGCVWGISV